MKTASFKKISAAALAAVLGFSVVSKAAPITSYSDNNSPLTGTYTESDSAPNAATYSAGVVTLNNANTPSSPGYSDFQPSTPGSAVTFSSLSAAPETSGGTLVTIQFTMNTSISTAPQSAVGLSVEDNNGDIVASLLSTYGADHLPDGIASDGADGGVAIPGPFATAADGVNAVYTLTLDPTNNVYFANYNGETYEGTMWQGGLSGLSLSDFSLAAVDIGSGNGSATFSDLTITTAVPEPASIAMIGIGGVMLLARRPKRQQA
jgi:hypothetical protein